jgi:hypothetical protein
MSVQVSFFDAEVIIFSVLFRSLLFISIWEDIENI